MLLRDIKPLRPLLSIASLGVFVLALLVFGAPWGRRTALRGFLLRNALESLPHNRD